MGLGRKYLKENVTGRTRGSVVSDRVEGGSPPGSGWQRGPPVMPVRHENGESTVGWFEVWGLHTSPALRTDGSGACCEPAMLCWKEKASWWVMLSGEACGAASLSTAQQLAWLRAAKCRCQGARCSTASPPDVWHCCSAWAQTTEKRVGPAGGCSQQNPSCGKGKGPRRCHPEHGQDKGAVPGNSAWG